MVCPSQKVGGGAEDLQALLPPDPACPGLLLPGKTGNMESSGGNGEVSFLLTISEHVKDEFARSSSSTTEPQPF